MAEITKIIDHWNDQKGFGFISTAEGEKYFFHIPVVRGAFRPQQGE
ncbi:MAG TPA: hypothetical protein DIW64_02185 [Cellvibrio sp.]|nr:hypothetical protein [Cellvibrio sp.]